LFLYLRIHVLSQSGSWKQYKYRKEIKCSNPFAKHNDVSSDSLGDVAASFDSTHSVAIGKISLHINKEAYNQQ